MGAWTGGYVGYGRRGWGMKKLALASVMAVSLVGCATTPPSLTLKRNITERIMDVGIENQIVRNLAVVEGLGNDDYRIGVNAFAGEVLLTGEVPNETVKRATETMARSIQEVSQVHNYLTVSKPPKSHSHTVHENYLRAKIVAKLITKIHPSQYSIVVRDDIAYIMGAFTYEQLMDVQQAVKKTDGVLGFDSLAQVFMTQDEIDRAGNLQSVPSGGYVVTGNQSISTPYPPLSDKPAYAPYPQHSYPQTGYSQNSYPTSQESDYIRLYQGKNAP